MNTEQALAFLEVERSTPALPTPMTIRLILLRTVESQETLFGAVYVIWLKMIQNNTYFSLNTDEQYV